MSETLPQWIKDQIKEQKKQRGEYKGWGGKREGAGRKKQLDRLTIVVKMNRIKRMNLEELGDGDVQAGVQRLIDDHV